MSMQEFSKFVANIVVFVIFFGLFRLVYYMIFGNDWEWGWKEYLLIGYSMVVASLVFSTPVRRKPELRVVKK